MELIDCRCLKRLFTSCSRIEGKKCLVSFILFTLRVQVLSLSPAMMLFAFRDHEPIFFVQLSSAREPLQAKIRELEKDMQKLEKKFSKAKAENEKVRTHFVAS